MNAKDAMMRTLDDMESVVRLFAIEPFDIYFMGGAACLLGGYTDRATLDFDFVDLPYEAKMGRVFAILRDYDMLEYESTILAPEDIVVSKIIRLAPKDWQDMDELMVNCSKEQINDIINSILVRNDLFESKKKAFKANLPRFKERYDVWNFL